MTTTGPRIKLGTTTADLRRVSVYMSDLLKRSGLEGATVYRPFAGQVPEPADLFAERQIGWHTSRLGTGWIRTWMLLDGGQVVGHLELREGADPTRLSVWIGLRDDYRGRGLGTRLLKHGIAYARRHGKKAIDFDVISQNERALKMCERLGFKQTSVVKGAFVVGQLALDDIKMTLDLTTRLPS